ncbi:MAG: ABC transporter permease [Chthoniobacterales bacterium]
MRGFGLLRDRWLGLVRKDAVEAEIANELRWHLEQLTEEKIRDGLSPAAAQREARLEFGGFESLRERCREIRGGGLIEQIAGDCRMGLRVLGKQPLLSLVSLATAALAVAATCTGIAIADATFLRPWLPCMDAKNVAIIQQRTDSGQGIPFSVSDFSQFKAAAADITTIAAQGWQPAVIRSSKGTETADTRFVTNDFLSVIGTPLLYGRDFVEQDGRQDAPGVCLLVYEFAASHFASARAAVGQQLIVNDSVCRVAGVLPQHFHFVGNTDILLPVERYAEPASTAPLLTSVARLKSTQSRAAMESELGGIARRLARASGLKIAGVNVLPLTSAFSDRIRLHLLVVVLAAAVVLLAACLTAANLSLARLSLRWRELSLRVALGASARRITLQLLTEDLPIGFIGGVLGLSMAAAILRAMKTIPYSALHPGVDLGLNGLVLASGLVAVILVHGSGAIASRKTIRRAAGGTATSATSYQAALLGPTNTSRSAIIATQAVLSFVLLSAAFLLLRDFVVLTEASLGFEPKNLFFMRLPATKELLHQPDTAYSEFEQAVKGTPGVDGAVFSVGAPMFYLDPVMFSFEPQAPQNVKWASFATVCAAAPGFLELLGVQLVGGRFIQPTDTNNSAPVAAVDESFIDPKWGNPVGQRLVVRLARGVVVARVVGVVRHISHYGPSTSEYKEPQIYLAFAQVAGLLGDRIAAGAHVVFRVDQQRDAAAVAEQVAAKVSALAGDNPLPVAETARERVSLYLNPRRGWLLLIGFFGTVAFALAIAGTYGASKYAIVGQSRDRCIRLALGCSRRQIVTATCGPILRSVLAGLAVGIPLSFVTNRVLSTVLGLHRDYAYACGTLAATCTIAAALAACFLPARQIFRTNMAILNVG